MTFDELNLNKLLLRALADLGYSTPTPIQQAVFPIVLSGRDVCGIAQTGTGKTLAYLLPCLRLFQFAKDKQPQVLILVPTRELVEQVVQTVRQLTTYLNVATVGVYGGANVKAQVAELQSGVDVLVATPGRLTDLLLSGAVRPKALKRLVIDEVDEMLNLGFRAQLNTILDLLPPKRQNLLFSATLTDAVEQLIQTYFNNPVRVEAAPAGTPLATIGQGLYRVPNFYTKVNLLRLLLRRDATLTKVLVFVATKALADQLLAQLSDDFPRQVGVVHGNKGQNQRFDAVAQLETGTYRVLIATDLAARGIDIADVSHVVNFDLPEEPERYVHRIGRTGRAQKTGVAIAFVTDRDDDRLRAIEALMQYPIPVLPLPDDLVVTDELTDDERPAVRMKAIDLTPGREDVGPAFHEKAPKNQKVNVRRDHAAEKRLKYGRPIRRSGKK